MTGRALHSQSRSFPSVNQSSVHIILRPVVQTDFRTPPHSFREGTRCYSDQNLTNTIQFNLVSSSRICGVLRHCLFCSCITRCLDVGEYEPVTFWSIIG